MPHREPSAERLLQQRAELLEEAVGFATHLGPDGQVLDVSAVRRALARFRGRLRTLAAAQETAGTGRPQHADAVHAFEAFVTRWHALAIAKDPPGFARELRTVTSRLVAYLEVDDPAALAG